MDRRTKPPARSASPEFAYSHIEPFEIGAHLIASSLVHDLAPHRIADIGCAGASGRQSAPHAVDAFTEDNLDSIDALAQDDDIQGLPSRRHPNRDFLVVHAIVDSPCEPGLSWMSGRVAVPVNGQGGVLHQPIDQKRPDTA